jgi:hypothetical protein
VTISSVAEGDAVTATATDGNGSTSEFSRNLVVSQGTTPTPTPVPPTATSTPLPTETPTATPTLTPTPVLPTPTALPATTYAADTFSRNVTDGWGSAETGGAYSLSGTAANFNVTGNVGTLVVPAAGNTRTAVLPSMSAQDVDLVVRVQTDKAATGGPQYAYGVARRVSSSTEYRGQVRLLADGSVRLRASRVVAGTETLLDSDVVVSGLTHRPNTSSGCGCRSWAPTQPHCAQGLGRWQAEPSAWQYSVTDSEASLQVAGAVGLRVYIAGTSTNAPVLFTFDDFLVSSIASP